MKAGEIKLRLTDSYEHAYTVIDGRVDVEAVRKLLSEVKEFREKVIKEHKTINDRRPGALELRVAAPFSFLRKPWEREVQSLKTTNCRLAVYQYITEMILNCELGKYEEAAKRMLTALNHYMEMTAEDSKFSGGLTTQEHLQRLAFKWKELFKFIDILEECQGDSSAVIEKLKQIEQKIHAIEMLILDFMDADKIDPAWLSSQNEEFVLYSDLFTYFGYVVHDSLNYISISKNLNPCTFNSQLQQALNIRYQTVILNEKLRILPILFEILAAANNSHNYIAYNNLAYCYAVIGCLHEAEEYANISIKVNPYFPLSHFNLALIRQKKGDMKRANKEFEEAEKLCSSNKPVEAENRLLSKIKNARREESNNPFAATPILSKGEMDKIRRFEERAFSQHQSQLMVNTNGAMHYFHVDTLEANPRCRRP